MFRATEPQGNLFGGLNRLSDWVGETTIYVWLGKEGRNLFPDEMFREHYCEDNGRPCVWPSKVAVLTFLQMMHRCSDQETIERSKYDDRWKCALDLRPEEQLCGKGTLQRFRANLHLENGAERKFLRCSLLAARKSGLLPAGSRLRAVLDTTPLLGRGAVKDTFNLVADGICNLLRALSSVTGERLEPLARRLDLSRYLEGSSLKGDAPIDWSNAQERRTFLNALVADAQRLLLEVQQVRERGSEKQQAVLRQAEGLLRKLIHQDTEPDPDDPKGGVRLKQGVARDRTVSVHDPEMRHGRKSSSNRFDGHKTSVAADAGTGLVTAVEVQAGNSPDNQHALDLVEATEKNTGMQVGKSVGDCAYGDGATRQAFAEKGREHVAKVPAPPANKPFHKAHFEIDLEQERVTCPAGHQSGDFRFASKDGTPVKRFFFPERVCQKCPHRAECLSTRDGKGGRTVTLHPQEKLLQEAREYQKTPEFQEDNRARQRAEHRLAAMIRLGGRQAPYVGILKNKTRTVLVAAVLNVLLLFGFLQTRGKTLPALGAENISKEAALLPRPDLEADGPVIDSPGSARGVSREFQQTRASCQARGDPPLVGFRSARGDP